MVRTPSICFEVSVSSDTSNLDIVL